MKTGLMNQRSGSMALVQTGAVTRRALFGKAAGLSGAGTVLLAACNPLARGPSGPPIALRPGTTLTVMGGISDAVQQQTTKFTAQTGVQVNLTPQVAAYYDRLVAMAASGELPDAFVVNAQNLGRLWPTGALTDLAPLARRDRYDLSDFYPPLLANYTRGGKLWGLQFGSDPIFLLYNTDSLQRVGVKVPPADWKDKSWTLDAFVDATRRLTGLGPSGEKRWGVVFRYDNFQFYTMPFVWTLGGDFFSNDGSQPQFFKPETMEGLQFVVDLIHKYQVVPPLGDLQSGPGLPQRFTTGQAAMIVGGASSINGLRNVAGFSSWDVAALPQGRAGPVTQSSVPAWVLAKGPRVEEAWAWCKLICGKETQELLAATGLVPSRKSVAESPVYLESGRGKPPAHLRVLPDSMSYVRRSPFFLDRWLEVQTTIANELESMWEGTRSVRATMTVLDQVTRPLLK